MTADPFGGLSPSARSLLADPPVTEKKLVELIPVWLSPPSAEVELAEAIRLFVITWDPLELSPPRPVAFTAVNVDPLELAVYLPYWSLVEFAAAHDTTIAAVLTAAATSVVAAGVTHREVIVSGDYPDLALRGQAPDLLADLVGSTGLGAITNPADPAGSTPGLPRLAVASPQWDDIGLGMIQDAVQHAFGIVDLDRSPVELAARRPEPDCPACAGRRFDFPADLAESRDDMCLVHRGEAEGVIKRRLARAEVSNPAGWRAIGEATQRLELPHLPNGLATRLASAGQEVSESPDTDLLGERARLVVEAAQWFEGQPGDLWRALGEDPYCLLLLPDWLVCLPLDLTRAGLSAEASMVGEALGRVDPVSRDLVGNMDLLAAMYDERRGRSARTSGTKGSIVRNQRRKPSSRARRKR